MRGRVDAGSRPVRIVLTVLAAVICLSYLVAAWRGFELDLDVYRAGGAAAFGGHHLYAAHLTGSGYQFTYPPISALLFAPRAALPQQGLQLLWTLVSLVALWLVVRLSLDRYAAPGIGANPAWVLLTFVLVAVSDPLRVGFGLGQIDVMIALLVLLDFCGTLPRLPRGVLIGVASAVKLTPLFLIAYLVVVRRYRAAVGAAATFLVLTLAAFAVMPVASADFWWGGYVSDFTHFGLGYVSNQSVNGLIVRLLNYPANDKVLWLLAAVVVTAVVLWTAWRVEPARPWLAEAIAMAGMLAVSPVSWIHHWIFVLPLLVASLRLGAEPRFHVVRWLVVALAAVLLGRVIWLVTHTYRDSVPQFVVGSVDIGLLLALLATLAWLARDQQRLR